MAKHMGNSNANGNASVYDYDYEHGDYQNTTHKLKKRRWPWVLLIIVIVLVLAVGGIYVAGAYYFEDRFLPNTTLDGEDVSLQLASDVAAEKSASLDGLELSVSGDGLDFTITSLDVDLSVDGTTYANEALAQQDPWSWPLALFEESELTSTEASVSYDEEALREIVETAIDEVQSEVTVTGAAAITFNEETSSYELTEGASLSSIDTEAVIEAVSTALIAKESTLELGDEYLIIDTDLENALATANSYVSATITLTLADVEVEQVTASQIAGWITISDDLTVTLDEDAIAEWCHGDLSDELDTVGTDRTYTRPDGEVITVSDGEAAYGDSYYGWSIDGGTTATEIAALIYAGEPATLDIPCYREAEVVNSDGGQDWGDRYIDVDISEQHARFYDGGELIWEADIVTGQPSEDYDTPTGVWTITNKQDGDVNLVGPIDEDTGEPSWSSYVDFWMGVVGNLIGFHNAPWRSEFGGEIYLTNGSHGCINLSYDDAEELYSLVEVGDVVVIHD